MFVSSLQNACSNCEFVFNDIKIWIIRIIYNKKKLTLSILYLYFYWVDFHLSLGTLVFAYFCEVLKPTISRAVTGQLSGRQFPLASWCTLKGSSQHCLRWSCLALTRRVKTCENEKKKINLNLYLWKQASSEQVFTSERYVASTATVCQIKSDLFWLCYKST